MTGLPSASTDTPSEAAPAEVVALLFTDIEGSSRLEQTVGTAEYARLRGRHRQILRSAVAAHGGIEHGTEGDSFFVIFADPRGALAAATDAQRALAAEPWPAGAEVRVRMGIHHGAVFGSDGDYVGIAINLAARIEAAAHGGQVVVSDAMRAAIEHDLPDDVRFVDLGTHRLKDFEPMKLHQLVIAGLENEFPPLRSLESRIDTLPAQLTTFLGREREIDEIRTLLRAGRLVTLTGPGGTGKTRLGIASASAAIDDFRDGAAWIALASIADPDLVPSAVAKGLAVRDEGQGDLLDAIVRRIDQSELLLVLDNFEQVVAAAPFVGALLGRCPGLRVLVTSREVLHLAGEREYPVPPLATPDPDHLPPTDELARTEAVALFIERARAVRPDFELDSDNARPIAAICARLDGLPLAIELAAARIRVLTPAAIASRLDQSLGFLGGGARDLPERQQTLRGAIAWSFDLLEPDERTYASRLSVFVGGWSLADAETVCDPEHRLGLDVLDALGSLVDKSLVRLVLTQSDEPRYRMLTVIREYGLELLDAAGETELLRDRHLAAMAALSEAAERELVGIHSREWLDRVELEHDNIRAALRWALEADRSEAGLLTAGRLWRFWHQRGYLGEGLAMTQDLLACPAAQGPTPGRLKALNGAGGLAYWHNDYEAAARYYEEALALSHSLGDREAVAEAQYNLAFLPAIAGRYPEARKAFSDATDTFRELGNRAGEAAGVLGMALVAYLEKDYDEAEVFGRQMLSLAIEAGDRYREASAYGVIDRVLMETGRFSQAAEAAGVGMRLFVEAGDPTGVAMHLDDFGQLAWHMGDPLRALRLAGAAATVRERVAGGAPTQLVRSRDFAAEARMVVSEADATAAFAEGRAMDEAQAVAYALEALPAPGVS
jgi:predicted ATPase/class 3 adenylate cyclase